MTDLNLSRIHRDDGWTLVEALISVVLISILFLGFTISVLAFKEWMTRSWALRVMDQYANDVVSSINERLEVAFGIHQLPPQNGLGRFQLDLLDINLYNTQEIDSTKIIFSAHPQQGIKISEGNAAPKNIDPSIPFDEWWGEHNFIVKEFSMTPGTVLYPTTSNLYQQASLLIRLRFQYERIHMVDTDEGVVKESYFVYKDYCVSAFLKNYMHRPTSG